MFRFRKSGKDPLSDVRAAERWLATLPGDDTLAVHSDVVAQLDRVSGNAGTRTPHGLQAKTGCPSSFVACCPSTGGYSSCE